MNKFNSIFEEINKLITKNTAVDIFNRLILGFIVNVALYLYILWLVMKFFINFVATNMGFQEVNFWILILIWLFASLEIIRTYLIVEVEANTSQVFTGVITGKFYPKLPGFNWKSPWQVLKYTFDIRKDLEAKGKGDAEANGGVSGENDNMSFGWVVLFRVIPEMEALKKYAQTTEANIIAAITLAANMHITRWIYARTASTAKTEYKKGLLPRVFKKICDEYGIQIVQCGLNDLDFSTEVRELRKGQAGAKAFAAALKVLTDTGMPQEEANKTVKALMLKGNYKQIDITGNQGNNPVVINP